MRNFLLGAALAAALPLAAAPASAQAVCDRNDLQGAVKSYLAAQTGGDPLKIPLADFTQITEQGEIGSMSTGILSTPIKIDSARSLLDVQTCTTFTEVIAADPAHPYVIGTRLQYAGRFNPIAAERINDLEFIVTDKGDWQFDAAKTLGFAKAEDWTEIATAARDSRAILTAAANAYLDHLNDVKVQVPWATDCERLDGGRHSTAAASGGGCDAGLPSGVKVTERRYIVDETLGAVAVLGLIGSDQSPSVHLFRIRQGKIRYVHAMAVCKSTPCALDSATH